jgi:ATP-dependent DNA helicase RecG
LVRAGLLEKKGDKLLPTGFAVLLFGRRPRDAMPQAGLLGTIHYPNGREETRNFEGPMVLIPGEMEQWLRDKLPNTIDRSHMRRQRVPELPFELVREAVVNALVHRDYEIRGAKCQLIVTPDTITVKSPGSPLPPITLDQMQRFDAPMLSRNPELHYVFAQMEMAEERGLGLKSLQSLSERNGLPRPLYKMEEPYLALTLFRNLESSTSNLPAPLRDRLSADETRVWQFASTKESLSSPMLGHQFGFDERKAQRILRKLEENRLLRRHGRGRATRYEVVRT